MGCRWVRWKWRWGMHVETILGAPELRQCHSPDKICGILKVIMMLIKIT